jgi:hypothetical protein
MISTELLWLQEAALKLHLDPLKLILGSIDLDGGESGLCGSYLRALGFGASGMKFDEYGPLFIGLLVPTHRGCRVLYFLSTNQTQTRLCSNDFVKGLILRFVSIRKPN